ncbi:MAG: Nif3-like dinuclear metal center hexameric protein [Gemmatimonadales bacterium]
MTALAELAAYLDDYLRIREVPDEPNAVNGLQVENGGQVARIVAAVDASLETIVGSGRARAGEGVAPTLLLVHHGLFWDGNVPLTARRFRKVRALLERDTALYAAHIPLDVHPDVGNNVVLAMRLGLAVAGWFGSYRGIPIGVWGEAPPALRDRDVLTGRLREMLGANARLIPGGSADVRRIGIVTGGAGTMITAARDAGLDTFITGEGPHHTYFDAMEWGMNVVYAGHYATEQAGVQALAAHLAERFDLTWEFHHHPTGL